MLRLNFGSSWHSCNGHKVAQATFDEVTKSGKVKKRLAERFYWKDGVLELNGITYDLGVAIDIDAKPEDLMAWFKKITKKRQIDMFDLLNPPSSKASETSLTAVDINTLKWEYPEYEWRAVDKAGSIPYFKSRPTLDKAGFWIVYDSNEYPEYSDYLASNTDDYKRSLRRESV